MSTTYNPIALPKYSLDWIRESWGLVSAKGANWILVALIVGVINIAVKLAASLALGVPLTVRRPGMGFESNPMLVGTAASSNMIGLDIVSLVGYVVGTYLLCGVLQRAIAQCRGEATTIGMIFLGYRVFPAMLGYSLCFGIAVGIGTVFCVIPGLILAALMWPGFALVADGGAPVESLTRSFAAGKSDIGGGLLLTVVFGLILLVSAIPCGLGLLATIPMGWMITVLMYRDMLGMPVAPGSANAQGGVAVQPGVWPPPPNPYQQTQAAPGASAGGYASGQSALRPAPADSDLAATQRPDPESESQSETDPVEPSE